MGLGRNPKDLIVAFLPRGFTLEPSQLANIVKATASMLVSHLLRTPVVWGGPISIFIEPISRCNYQCPLCPVGARELKRELGSMTLDNFRLILDNVGPQVRTLALWNQGEPTINDALPEMIRYAHDKGIYTMTSTNGSLLLRRNLVERLITSGLDELVFSIDGLTQETYQVYRIGGYLKTVVEGMKAVKKRRDELGSATPRIVMQWLPMKHNEHELSSLHRKAVEWGADTVEIKTTQIYSEEQADKFLPQTKELTRYERKGKRWETRRRYQSCRRLWFSTMIDWNGNVVPCCFDKDEDFILGNALMEDFDEIWNGEAYQKFRTVLLTEGRLLDICQNCTEGLKSYYVPLKKMLKR